MLHVFTLNSEKYLTNEKNNRFAKVGADNKTRPIKKIEFETASADPAAVFVKAPAGAPDTPKTQPTPDTPEAPAEAKTERKPKGQRFDAHAKAVVLAPLPKEYTTKTDNRKRVSYKQDRDTIVMVQPAKDHFTVYVSKHLLETPNQVIDALKKTFKLDAKINPTYITNKGHDPFSVKATVYTTPDKLDNLVDLLIVKNNEVAKA